jgi:hypothetical protein
MESHGNRQFRILGFLAEFWSRYLTKQERQHFDWGIRNIYSNYQWWMAKNVKENGKGIFTLLYTHFLVDWEKIKKFLVRVPGPKSGTVTGIDGLPSIRPYMNCILQKDR